MKKGGSVLDWHWAPQKIPDYEAGFRWVRKAADMGDAKACEMAGIMLCTAVGCPKDVRGGMAYLEKALAAGRDSARKHIYLHGEFRHTLTDDEYDKTLSEFISAAESGDEEAYRLFSVLKSGAQKQRKRLNYALTAGMNTYPDKYEIFRATDALEDIPDLPVMIKRAKWRTLLAVDLSAFAEKYPLIALASDAVSPDEPLVMMNMICRAEVAGVIEYMSPSFGWLNEKKRGTLIRLGGGDNMSASYAGEIMRGYGFDCGSRDMDTTALFVEHGEKEYSTEIIGINGDRVDVLLRYTVGGSEDVTRWVKPGIISMEIKEPEAHPCREAHPDNYTLEADVPGRNVPGTNASGMNAPGRNAHGMSAPDKTVSDRNASGVKTPERKIPERKTPERKITERSASERYIHERSEPGRTEPGKSEPEKKNAPETPQTIYIPGERLSEIIRQVKPGLFTRIKRKIEGVIRSRGKK